MTKKSSADILAGFQKEGIRIGSFEEVPTEHGGISFGLVGLDRMFETGGIPRGRITQIVAEHNSGKSTLILGAIAALHAASSAGREKSGKVLFVNAENAFSGKYAEAIGIEVNNPEKFICYSPEDGIEAIEVMEALVDTGEIDLVVLDSITFLVPRAMLEADADKNLPAVQSRQNSMLVQRFVGRLSKTNTAMVIINHLSSGFKTDSYGNPILDIRGGRMLQNATSAIVWLKKTKRPVDEKGAPAKEMNDGVATDVTIIVKKNKLGRQDYEIPARLVFGSGFDPIYDLVQTCLDLNLVERRGAWYFYGEKHKWNGLHLFQVAVAEDVDLFQELRQAVLETR